MITCMIQKIQPTKLHYPDLSIKGHPKSKVIQGQRSWGKLKYHMYVCVSCKLWSKHASFRLYLIWSLKVTDHEVNWNTICMFVFHVNFGQNMHHSDYIWFEVNWNTISDLLYVSHKIWSCHARFRRYSPLKTHFTSIWSLKVIQDQRSWSQLKDHIWLTISVS